jgi:TonB family protein
MVAAVALVLSGVSGFAQTRLIHQVKPAYPAEAKQAGVTGVVRVGATIAPDGSVRDVRVIEGPAALAAAAVDAVRQWRYEPVRVDGQAVAVLTCVTMKFELPGSIGIADEVGGSSAVRVLEKVSPAYPKEAKASGLEGSVRLSVVVGKDGAVKRIDIREGEPSLAAAAEEAVRQWRYEPVLLDGQPVDVLVDVVVNFTLKR